MNFHTNGFCRIRTTVPPGRHIVAVYPHTLLRIERIELASATCLFIVRMGRRIPFDGCTIAIGAGGDRTLCMGCFLAIEVHNDSVEPRTCELTLHGTSVDSREVTASVGHGFFVQEADGPVPAEGEAAYGDYSLADGTGLEHP